MMTERRAPYVTAHPSYLEALMLYQIKAAGLPEPVREYMFAKPERKFRADFAFVSQKLLIECEGGVWAKSRHTTGAGYTTDCEKYNLAALLGYKVLRFTKDMIESGAALDTIIKALSDNKENHIVTSRQ